jgi:hypothetical protein
MADEIKINTVIYGIDEVWTVTVAPTDVCKDLKIAILVESKSALNRELAVDAYAVTRLWKV